MDTRSTNREFYRGLQNQISSDDSNSNEHNLMGHVAPTSCKCNSGVVLKWMRLALAVAILAIILSVLAITMVTIQWTLAIEGDQFHVNKYQSCSCPTGTDDSMVQGDDDVFNTEGPYDEITSENVKCPDCRTKRDGTRVSLLHSSPGRGSKGRNRNCKRACIGELDNLRSELLDQTTAIHFQGFPPAWHAFGQDGAYKWWRPSPWYEQMTGFFYNHTSGHVIVLSNGLYFIYSQVEHPANQNQAHSVMINDTVFLRCIKSVPTSVDRNPHHQSSCYVGGAIVLDRLDQIWIKGTHTGSRVHVRQESTYFGIIRMKELP